MILFSCTIYGDMLLIITLDAQRETAKTPFSSMSGAKPRQWLLALFAFLYQKFWIILAVSPQFPRFFGHPVLINTACPEVERAKKYCQVIRAICHTQAGVLEGETHNMSQFEFWQVFCFWIFWLSCFNTDSSSLVFLSFWVLLNSQIERRFQWENKVYI